MTIYYSPSSRGFFSDEIHGARTITIPDPDWAAPEEGSAPAEHPLLVIANPDCRLPSDSIEVSAQEHADLMSAQSSGLQITHDSAGRPVASAKPDPTDAELANAMRADRDARLKATDWTQAGDVPKATADKWRSYRQALRDVPQQNGSPALVHWPDFPV